MIAQIEALRQQLWQRHRDAAPRGYPVGGGDWMDTLFRLEALDGCLRSLRAGKPLAEALRDGQEASRAAVKIWNRRREYQVHRWEETAFDWLDAQIRKIRDSI